MLDSRRRYIQFNKIYVNISQFQFYICVIYPGKISGDFLRKRLPLLPKYVAFNKRLGKKCYQGRSKKKYVGPKGNVHSSIQACWDEYSSEEEF